MANVAGSGGAGGFWKAPPKAKPTHQFKATPAMLPPGAPPRKSEIDRLVAQSFTATPQGNALIAKRFKAMNLSPDELDYVKQSSATRGAAARKKANPLNTQVADMAQFGINPHVFKHPIARLEGKGEFAPSDVIGRNADGSPRYGYASMVPWFGGGEGKAAEEITSAVKPTIEELKKDPRFWDYSHGRPDVSRWGAQQTDALHSSAPKIATPPRSHPLISAKPAGVVLGPKTLGESVTEGLRGTRGIRTHQEVIRSEEKAKRAQAFGQELQANPTLAGAKAASRHLAGKYPEFNFGGFKEFSPEAHDAMVKAISDHPDLRPLEQKRAITGINRLIEGKLPRPSEEKLIRQVFGNQATNQLLKSVSVWRKIGGHGLDVANVPRAVQSSADVSGAARQALLMATGHPVKWAKNLGPMFHALTSEDYYAARMDELHSDPLVTDGIAEQMGLHLSELTSKAGTAVREEPFASPLAEKIPGVRMSSRAFTYFVNKNRVDLAKILYAKAVKDAGKSIPRLRTEGKLVPRWAHEPISPEDPELLSSIGRFANSATGRGDLGHGKIGNSADIINLVFYSPRLIKSRLDFINPVWYAKLHPVARHEAYRAMAGLVGLVMFADAVARVSGAKLNLDPRSSDFAKIKVGNTRIDLAGGFLQYLRVIAETMTMETVTQSGTVVPLAPFRAKGTAPNAQSIGSIYLRFLRNKLAPVTSGTVDVGLGKDTVGQPVGWSTLYSRFLPLAGQDAVSVGKDASSHGLGTGILAGVGAYGLSGLGLGVQNYKPKAPKQSGPVDPFSFGGSSDSWGSSGGSSNSFWGN